MSCKALGISSRKLTSAGIHHYHMVIHFDINETLLVFDDAGGDTKEDCINKMIAKNAFVRITQPPSEEAPPVVDGTLPNEFSTPTKVQEDTTEHTPTLWWNGKPIQDEYTADDVDNAPPLHLGWDWPKDCCPYYRTAYKKDAKTFIQKHGSIYKKTYDAIQQKLDESQKQTTEPKLLGQMIPAFFETLMTLFPSSKDDNGFGRSAKSSSSSSGAFHHDRITLVFRTMGTDLQDVADAVSAFARGEHPDYPDYYNEDLIIECPDQQLLKGRWIPAPAAPKKADDDDDDDEPLGGVEDQDCSGDADEEDDEDDMDELPDEHQYIYQLWNNDNDTMLAEGDDDVLDFLHSHTICGIQDDYNFWKEKNFVPWAGKPIWIPLPRPSEKNGRQSPQKQNSRYTINTSSEDLFNESNDTAEIEIAEAMPPIAAASANGAANSANAGSALVLHHHVLLDDNIHNLNTYSIGSIRKQHHRGGRRIATAMGGGIHSSSNTSPLFVTLPSVEIRKLHGLHLIRVPTIEPILNKLWFLRQIVDIQQRYLSRLSPDSTKKRK